MTSFATDRRAMIKGVAGIAGLATMLPFTGSAAAAILREGADARGWENGPMRWVQIAATDDDPERYDMRFWLDFLRRTHTQGVCLSAGGVTAFYPTKVPFHIVVEVPRVLLHEVVAVDFA